MYAYSSRVNSPDIDGFRVMLQPQNFSPAQCPPVSSSQAAGVSQPDGSLFPTPSPPPPTKHSSPKAVSLLPVCVTLSGLGVRIVVVVGSQQQIDTMIRERGGEPHYESGYRVTGRDTLRIAIEAAGQVRTACEQFLSKVGDPIRW